MKLFTCGELKQLTFNSYDNKSIVGKEVAHYDCFGYDPIVDANAVYDLYKNTRKLRNQNEDNNKTRTTRISSQARIVKVNSVADVEELGIKLTDTPNGLVLDEEAIKILYRQGIDGVYISKELSEALTKEGYQTSEHLKIVNPDVVSGADEKHKSGPRKYTSSKAIREINKILSSNHNVFEKIHQEGKSICHHYGLFTDEDGGVYYMSEDKDGKPIKINAEHLIDDNEKHFEEFYAKGQRKGGILDNSGILPIHFVRGYGNCGVDRIFRSITIDAVFAMNQYASLRENGHISENLRKQITPKAVAKAIYYHEVGHVRNNNNKLADDLSQEFDADYGVDENGYKKIPVDVFRKKIKHTLNIERQATDYAMNKIIEDKDTDVSVNAAKMYLCASLYTYNRMYKKYIRRVKGETATIGETKYVLI